MRFNIEKHSKFKNSTEISDVHTKGDNFVGGYTVVYMKKK